MEMETADPKLIDFPDAFESSRLLIRAPRFGDGAAVNEAVLESLDELKPWMPWAQTAPSVEQSELNVRSAIAAFIMRTDLRLMLTDKQTGRMIGGSGLHRMNWDVRSFEIGYWVRSSEAGKGYVTEAVQAITAFASERLAANRIEIRCDSINERSAAVAVRCGFTLEGVLRQDSRDSTGQLRDTKVFSKVRGAEFV
ncbi:GNAT family N-acetyltransferase [Paenibacillus pasadenensis]|nr:GNAT family N-acetyltransferase [Paenibacillus pasadenensis]MCM3749006.1 GNAT family N-acetyltransferase [Paenibacillus pasadenensis]